MWLERITEVVNQDLPPDPPEGFQEIPERGGFDLMVGPLFGRLHDDQLTMGFRCSPRHLNGHGTCHGGLLASFADMQAYAVKYEADLMDTAIPTVTLTTDYLRPVYAGDWVQAETTLLKAGRKLLFTQTVAKVNDKAVFRSNAVFAVGAPDHSGTDLLSHLVNFGPRKPE